ncbi:uncharacterized protein LODBEIA_P60130 [Lodderomyces beijingensis]|uniref:Peptidase A1 domain-containing protein n=1 Tax=Lodderomyces beijingensis TaxID=1775926 RepID=A0ABP0ZUH2_9ASCO
MTQRTSTSSASTPTITTSSSPGSSSGSPAKSSGSSSSSSSSSSRRSPTLETRSNSNASAGQGEEEKDSIFKMIFTIGTDDSYYNARFQFGGNSLDDDSETPIQKIGLRLDLTQPEIWVMNYANFIGCSQLYQWISSAEAQMSSGTATATATASLPQSITTRAEFTENCAKRGVYTSTSLAAMPQPQDPNVAISNGESYMVPYMNQIVASGEFATDKINFNITNGMNFELDNVTFLDANETNMYVGGLGLALHAKGTGFLPRLVQAGIIRSPGYSLWFNNYSDVEHTFAQLIPGVVDQKYYIGDLHQFQIVPHVGSRYAQLPQIDADLAALTLPVINLDDIRVENLDSGESLSIKSNDEALPVVLDSRIIYSYLPQSVIVNLAVQTNAYYSPEAGRWLVECDTLSSGNATIVFKLGSNLSIKVPTRDFITDAIYQNNLLKFESGANACYLTFLPTESSGYSALGLPFLRHIYLVVDNEGGNIAVAETNKYLEVDRDSLLNDDQHSNFQPFNQTKLQLPLESSNNTMAYIEAGSIPFAKTTSFLHPNATLSYSQVQTLASYETVVLDIPARLSGAVIRSGSIYVTGYTGGSSTSENIGSMLTALSGVSSGGAPPRANLMGLDADSKRGKSAGWCWWSYFVTVAVAGVGFIVSL